jgi:hypothetical protein
MPREPKAKFSAPWQNGNSKSFGLEGRLHRLLGETSVIYISNHVHDYEQHVRWAEYRKVMEAGTSQSRVFIRPFRSNLFRHLLN